MWKKFLASMAIVGLMASSASALGGYTDDGNTLPGGVTVGILTLDVDSTFNPVNGSTPIDVTVSEDAEVYVQVLGENNAPIENFGGWYTQAANTTSVADWYGTDDNTATGNYLADGEYTVSVAAKDTANGFHVVSALVTVDSNYTPALAVDVTGLTVTDAFSPLDGEEATIEFTTDQASVVNVVVEDANGVQADLIYNDVSVDAGTTTINWDGANLTPGVYTVVVTASNSNGSDSESALVEVEPETTNSNGIIEDVELDPSSDWDPTDDVLEITFELTEEADELFIYAYNGSKVVEIDDDRDLDDDDYTFEWNGEDDDGDYVSAGTWTIIVEADNSVVGVDLDVVYERPEITEAFVTKESFDPSEDEFTNLVFKVDTSAVVTVEVYDGTRREFTLVDEEEVRKNRYYAVKWDGLDEDGDEVDEGTNWRFKITAENAVDDDINDVEYVNVDVEEDSVSSRKSNATNDYTDPIVFDEDEDTSVTISYCIDEDADVYLAVYDGRSTTGSADIVLLDYVDQSAGCHTVQWDGQDEDGKDLDNGINSYKLVTKIGTSKDTEIGRFVVGTEGEYINGGNDDDDDDDDDDDLVDGSCGDLYWDLAYLADGNELCEAITWATEEGIFQGYQDGSFKAYQNINRAEVLKVVLEAFDVNIFSMSGSKEGFSDVDPYAWYMKYVRTAKYYGMLHGYGDGTARLENNINRVELLKFVLEASDTFTSYEMTPLVGSDIYADVDFNDLGSKWFYGYADESYKHDLYNSYNVGGKEYLRPGQLVERGEVALLLYRMAQADLM